MKCESLFDRMEEEKLHLEKLFKENPKKAKKEAKEALIRMGLINKDGSLKPPYNGEKVNEDDFEMGPSRALIK